MKFGLLMESAQAHQKLAEQISRSFGCTPKILDMVVRDEIRRTLIEELQMLTAESKRATEVLRRIGRGAVLRGALWSVADRALRARVFRSRSCVGPCLRSLILPRCGCGATKW